MSGYIKKIKKSMVGERVFNLTVLSESRKVSGRKNRVVLDCVCICGKNVSVFKNARTKSCGCIKLKYEERVKSSFIRNSWSAMKERCQNPKNSQYKRYGAKGIKVCERWMLFRNFYDDTQETWAEGLSIDRFPNNTGNYQPDNFRWATMTQQGQNKSGNKLNADLVKEIRLSSLTVNQLSTIYNVHPETIRKVKKNIRWINI